MALKDWNNDGEMDSRDDIMEYYMFEQLYGNQNNQQPNFENHKNNEMKETRREVAQYASNLGTGIGCSGLFIGGVLMLLGLINVSYGLMTLGAILIIIASLIFVADVNEGARKRREAKNKDNKT